MVRQLAFGCFVVVLVMSARSLPAQDGDHWPAIVRAKLVVIDDGDDPLLKLWKTVFNSAIKEIQISFQCYRLGIGDPQSHIESLHKASGRLADAALELYPDKADRMAFLQGQIEMAKIYEETMMARWLQGDDTELKYHRARFDRLTAEIRLVKTRRAAGATKKNQSDKVSSD